MSVKIIELPKAKMLHYNISHAYFITRDSVLIEIAGTGYQSKIATPIHAHLP